VTESFTIAPVIDVAQVRADSHASEREVVFDIRDLTVSYGRVTAISDVNLQILRNIITGDHRSVGLRQEHVHPLSQPHERSCPGTRIEGQILYQGSDLYASGVDPVEVRRRIGMVFQKANPFPKSIYDNVAWGPRVLGMRKDLDERVEKAVAQCGSVG
jgi:phosphate transport system ATP-binding protein